MYFITAGQTSVAFNNPTAGNYLVRVGDLSDISCQSSCTITLDSFSDIFTDTKLQILAITLCCVSVKNSL